MRSGFRSLLLASLLLPALHAQAPKAPDKKPPAADQKGLEDIAKFSKLNEAYQAGLQFFSKGKGDEAVAKFTEALALVDGFTDARFARGRTYYEMKRAEPAVADLTRVIADKPDMADAYYFRGLAQWNLHKPAEALADFDKAISKEPRNSAFREKRALLREQEKQYAGARDDLDIVVALNPLDAPALEQRARVHKLMGEKELAEQDEMWAGKIRDAGLF